MPQAPAPAARAGQTTTGSCHERTWLAAGRQLPRGTDLTRWAWLCGERRCLLCAHVAGYGLRPAPISRDGRLPVWLAAFVVFRFGCATSCSDSSVPIDRARPSVESRELEPHPLPHAPASLPERR